MARVQRSMVAASLVIVAVGAGGSNAPTASGPPLHAAAAVQPCFTTMIVDGDDMPAGFHGHYRSITEALQARSLRAHSDLAALQVGRSQYTEEDRQAVAAFAAQVPAWDALLKAPDTLMAVDASGNPHRPGQRLRRSTGPSRRR